MCNVPRASGTCLSLLCPPSQAKGGCPGDAALCRHGDDAEVRIRGAAAAVPGCAHRGKSTGGVFSVTQFEISIFTYAVVYPRVNRPRELLLLSSNWLRLNDKW